jgi:hypothetical protein
MEDTTQRIEDRRALLEKHLRENLLRTRSAANTAVQVIKPPAIDPRAQVVAIQSAGSRQPFFFLHGDFKGGAFFCFPLSRDLGLEQPFYALEPYSFDGQQIPPSIEEMVLAHITSMRAIQPKGPYLLGGFCNGGVVAYEMARQLQAVGETVGVVVVIDAAPFAFLKPMHDGIKFLCNLTHRDQERQVYWYLWMRHMYRYLLHWYRCLKYPHYRKLRAKPDREEANSGEDGEVYVAGYPQASASTVLILKDLFEFKIGQGTERMAQDEVKPGRKVLGLTPPKCKTIFPESLFPPVEALRADYPGLFYWAAADYIPSSYQGKSAFLFFQESKEHRREKVWCRLAQSRDQKVEIHVVAGSHVSCKGEHIHDLAECLRICLDNAQAKE